jgi:outer membrane lipoprotein-sorting protein
VRFRRPTAFLGVALLAGCGVGGANSVSPAEVLAQTTAKTAAVKSFHFRLAVENAPKSSTGLTLTEANGDLAVPDRVRAAISGSLGGLPVASELVVLRKRAFIKDPLTHAWQRLNLRTTPLARFDPRKSVLAILRGAAGLRLAGTQQVDGVDAYHLTGEVPAHQVEAPLGGTAQGRDAVDIWVGKDDWLLRRVRLRKVSGVRRTLDLSSFGEPVSVKAPRASV